MTYHVRIVGSNEEGCILSVKGKTEWKTKSIARQHGYNLNMQDFAAIRIELRNEFNELVEVLQGIPALIIPTVSIPLYRITDSSVTGIGWVAIECFNVDKGAYVHVATRRSVEAAREFLRDIIGEE